MRILLVEDNDAQARLIDMALRDSAGHVSVGRVSGGEAALAFLQNADLLPDVILLDLKMPRMDGFQVLRVVKKNRRWKWIPVVILTTSNADKDRQLAYDLGANGYMVKPADYEGLEKLARGFTSFWVHLNKPPHELQKSA